MSIFAYIFLLSVGGYMIRIIYLGERIKFRHGLTNHHLKLRKAICSEQDFVAKLKINIFQHFLIRFVLIGILAALVYAYVHTMDGSTAILDDLTSLSWTVYLTLWVTSSVTLMCFRVIAAQSGLGLLRL